MEESDLNWTNSNLPQGHNASDLMNCGSFEDARTREGSLGAEIS